MNLITLSDSLAARRLSQNRPLSRNQANTKTASPHSSQSASSAVTFPLAPAAHGKDVVDLRGRQRTPPLQFGGMPPSRTHIMFIEPGCEEEYDRAVHREHKLSMGAIVEELDGQRAMMDLDTKLLSQGTVTVEGPVTDFMSQKLRREMLYLASKRREDNDAAPIFMIIDSPGGSVSAMFSIVDSIHMARNTTVNGKHIPVIALVNGHAASAASIIACCATACYMTPHSEFMLHAPIYGVQGGLAEHTDTARRITKMVKRILEIYTHKTGYPEKDLGQWMHRGERWLDEAQAKQMGLSQGTVHSFEELARIGNELPPQSHEKRPSLWEIVSAPTDFDGLNRY